MRYEVMREHDSEQVSARDPDTAEPEASIGTPTVSPQGDLAGEPRQLGPPPQGDLAGEPRQLRPPPQGDLTGEPHEARATRKESVVRSVSRDDVEKNWMARHKTSVVAWTAAVTAGLVSTLLLSPVQTLINRTKEAVNPPEHVSVSVTLGPEKVGFLPGYPDDPFMEGETFEFGGTYYFERGKLTSAGTPPVVRGEDGAGCDATRDWAVQHGGLDYERTIGQIILTAKSNLVVTNASAAREFKDIGTQGELAYCPAGGTLGTQFLFINLDDGSVSYLRGDSNGDRSESLPFGFQLQPGESERIVFVAEAGRMGDSAYDGLIEWRLKLDALVDGERQDILLGNEDGSPFRTVAGGYDEHDQLAYFVNDDAWLPIYG